MVTGGELGQWHQIKLAEGERRGREEERVDKRNLTVEHRRWRSRGAVAVGVGEERCRCTGAPQAVTNSASERRPARRGAARPCLPRRIGRTGTPAAAPACGWPPPTTARPAVPTRLRNNQSDGRRLQPLRHHRLLRIQTARGSLSGDPNADRPASQGWEKDKVFSFLFGVGGGTDVRCTVYLNQI